MLIQQSIPARSFVMANMPIFRVLPHLHRRMVGPFILMDSECFSLERIVHVLSFFDLSARILAGFGFS